MGETSNFEAACKDCPMLTKTSLALAAAFALAGASAPAHAAMLADGLNPAPPSTMELAQFDIGGFLFGGRNYCWYDGGWRGPGWYWCGYAYRTGYGWGGGEGWRGRYHGHRGGDGHRDRDGNRGDRGDRGDRGSRGDRRT